MPKTCPKVERTAGKQKKALWKGKSVSEGSFLLWYFALKTTLCLGLLTSISFWSTLYQLGWRHFLVYLMLVKYIELATNHISPILSPQNTSNLQTSILQMKYTSILQIRNWFSKGQMVVCFLSNLVSETANWGVVALWYHLFTEDWIETGNLFYVSHWRTIKW